MRKTLEERICARPECNNRFWAKVWNHKYCSEKCAKIVQEQQMREYMRKKREQNKRTEENESKKQGKNSRSLRKEPIQFQNLLNEQGQAFFSGLTILFTEFIKGIAKTVIKEEQKALPSPNQFKQRIDQLEESQKYTAKRVSTFEYGIYKLEKELKKIIAKIQKEEIIKPCMEGSCENNALPSKFYCAKHQNRSIFEDL